MARPFRRIAKARVLQPLGHLWRALTTARLISASPLFDPVWYGRDGTQTGPRIKRALHYVLRGAAQGRSPSADFDGDWYLRRYPQVALAGFNPLGHYLTHGRQAGLAIHPAAQSALPRQALSTSTYRAWIAEMARLDSPRIATLTAEAARLPPIAISGPGSPCADNGATHVLFLPEGVILAENALLELGDFVRSAPLAELVYADEDLLDAQARRETPWFKPDWDPELMRSGDLTGPATLFSRQLLDRLGWDGQPPDACGLCALALRATALECRIAHIPKILFHRKSAPVPRRWLTPQPRAVPADLPSVSIIIPTRDRAALLRVAAAGVLEHTEYPALELLIVDNGSQDAQAHRLLSRLSADPRVSVLRAPGAFNWSAMNNQAARIASGRVLVLLNNDMEIIAPDWLSALVAQAIRPGIGAAGATLLYPNRTLQHVGMTLSPYGFFRHPMRGAPAGDPGMFGEIAVTRSVAAVTGACLAIRKEVFDAVGGLNEAELALTHNDIDLCLRVRAAGHRVIHVPDSVLVHHEAATRGFDMSPAQLARVHAEWTYLRQRWGALAAVDPYVNSNLCLFRDRFGLESPARLVAPHGGGPLHDAAEHGRHFEAD